MAMDGHTAAGPASAAPDAIKNASDLREYLSRAELAVAGLGRATADDAANSIRLVDAVEKAIPRLEEQFGIDLKNERGRLQILENRLRNSAPVLLKRAGRKRLQQMRLEAQPSDAEWWWFLDEAVAAQRQQSLRSLAIKIGIGVAVLVVLGIIYQVFLAPKTEPSGPEQAKSDGQSYLQQGDLDKALAEYQSVLQADPEDAQAAGAVAAILEQLGRGDEAKQYFDQARSLAASEADYYANLAMTYYYMSSQQMVDATAKAIEAANQAIAADDTNAMAYLALGSAYELQDKVGEAVEALNKAASLTNDVALQASIKVRVAMLSQRVGGLPGTEVSTSAPQ